MPDPAEQMPIPGRREFNRSQAADVGSVLTQGSPIGVRVDPEGEGAYFSHDPSPEVVFGNKLAEKHALSDAERLFVVGHEFKHFSQYLQSPDTFKRIFEMQDEKAGGDPQLKESWHRFFNTFLDVHVNALTMQGIQRFKTGDLRHVPAELYREKLFKNEDYFQSPLSQQLCDYMLRKMMVPDTQIQISPEVQELINQPVKYIGQEYASLEEFVRSDLFNPRTKMSDFLFDLENVVMPAFEKLLEQDKQEGKLPKPGEGKGEGMGDDMFDPTNPDNFKEVDKYLKESKKTASEKAKEIADRQFAHDRTAEGFSPEQIQEMQARRDRMEPVANNIKTIWQNLIQKYTDLYLQDISHQRRGSGVDPFLVSEQFGVLMTNPDQAEIYTSSVVEEGVERVHPKEITFYFALDTSGSMFSEGGGKRIQAAKDVHYAVGQSLVLFEREGQWNNEHFPVKVRFVSVPFGSDIPRTSNGTADESQMLDTQIDEDTFGSETDMWKYITKVPNLGGTNDEKGLEHIQSKVEVQDKRPRIEHLQILIEITDGETQNPQEANQIKKDLEERGVICKRIRISEQKPDSPESNQTDTNGWGKDELTVWTEAVETELPEAVKSLLAGVLLASPY